MLRKNFILCDFLLRHKPGTDFKKVTFAVSAHVKDNMLDATLNFLCYTIRNVDNNNTAL